MMQGWKRLVAAAAALAMMLSVLPAQWMGETAYAAGATGTVTADGVFVRKQPDTGANYWFKLDKGFECEVLDVTTTKGVTWYKVNSTHPNGTTDNTYIGYIHGDYFTLNAVESDAPATDDATTGDTATGDTTTDDSTVSGDPTGEEDNAAGDTSGDAATDGDTTTEGDSTTGDASTGDTAETILVGEVNADLVNFRKTEDGALIEKLNRGTRVEILSSPAVIDSNHWYKVRYEGQDGYIQAPFVTVIGTTSSSVNDYGYVRLILSSANLRVAPSGKIAAQWESPGETLPVTGPSQTKDGYTWYPVLYKGSYYFVRNDCVQLVSGITSPGDSSSSGSSTVVAKGYLVTTKKGVNLRLQPGGDVIEQIDKNTVVTRLSDAVSADGYTWYLVQVDGMRGYMRSDCVAHSDANGAATAAPTETTSPQVTSSPDSTTSAYGYVITTQKGVNLRAKPAGSSQEQIDQGVILPLIGNPVTSGKYDWYPVRAASGTTGYLRSDCVRVCTSDGTATTLPTVTVPGTTVTSAPSTSSYGYVMIKSKGVNVRKTAGGTSIGQVDKDTVWPMTGDSVTKGGYTWYPINANGLKGYVRGDHSFKLSAAQEASYLAGNGVPSEESTTVVTTQYVQTIADKVYLRAAASKDAEAPYQVALGTVLAFNTSQKVGGIQWYRVIYDNTEVWIHGDYVKVMTQAEYDAYLATNPESTPQPEIIKGYVKTTTSKVNVRTTAGGSSKLGQIDKDVVMPYSADTTAKGYTWYYVQSPLGYGYVRSDCVILCDKNGDTVTSGTPGGSNTSGQEASYSTLKLGSKGTAVTNLVTELQIQGYYTGTITSSYTTAVQEAVKRFQSANGLEVDGIAGSQTQHKLYGTVPVGQGDSSNLTMTIYPAEKIDWYTGGIQQLWAKGSSYKVYDVKTGIVWWARRWSGAAHADVEPLTAADTARLCKIYGVDDAQDIWDDNLWQRRPCLVTIGSRTFACSLMGMPHNEDGDTIPDNNMTGQVCIHFVNSKTHDSNKVDTDHQEAIEYAWKNAPNGHK